jgi:outer membrane protein OmpA-like peptidoglycan-associated protein
MKNLKQLFILSLVALVMFGCGFGKMVPKSQVQMKLDNPDLENKGGKVEYVVKGTVPPKFLKKKATMDIQVPVIMTDENGTTKEVIKTVKLVGQKSKEEGVRIPYKTGGTFTVSGSFDFKEEYEDQNIYALQTARLKKKEFTYTPVLVTEGISNTASKIALYPTLSDEKGSGTTLLFAPHNYKPEFISQVGTIYFELDRSNLNWNLKLNRDVTSKQLVKDFQAFMDNAIADGRVIDKVIISGWASPEGEESRNQGLSEKRFEEGKKWFQAQLNDWAKKYAKKNKLKLKDVKLPEIVYENNAKGEDWMGFQTAVEKSNIPEKNKILNVVQSQPNNQLKEQKIREMTDIYPEIANVILPPLRRVEITMVCNKNLFTEQQIPEVAKNDPSKLTLNERLFGAAMTKDLATKEAIYKAIIAENAYQSDWRAYNSLAALEINKFMTDGNAATLKAAKDHLEKANAISPNNGIIFNNMAIAYFLGGDLVNAKAHFEKSARATVNPVKQDYNLGLFKILEGDYAGAKLAMGNKSCDYSMALAQILSKDYAAAKATLECITPKDAKVYYLLAVVAARTNVEQDVYKNLDAAIKADATMKAKAKKDAEFKKFKKTEQFIKLVQ